MIDDLVTGRLYLYCGGERGEILGNPIPGLIFKSIGGGWLCVFLSGLVFSKHGVDLLSIIETRIALATLYSMDSLCASRSKCLIHVVASTYNHVIALIILTLEDNNKPSLEFEDV